MIQVFYEDNFGKLYSSMVEQLTFNQLVVGSSPARVSVTQSQKDCYRTTIAGDLEIAYAIPSSLSRNGPRRCVRVPQSFGWQCPLGVEWAMLISLRDAENNDYLLRLIDGWVAEWLTRLAVNQIPYGVAGSNPAPPNMVP